MKKLTKIACLLWVLIAIVIGCKKNDSVESDSGVVTIGNSELIAGDGKWDLLGYGYDITGEIFERKNASKAPIIDVDRFHAAYPNRIPTPTDTKGGFNVYCGATAYDYMKDVNKKKSFGLKATLGGDTSNKFYGTTNFSRTNESQNTYTYSSKYSYATYESWFRVKSIDFTDDVTVDMLTNYLTPEFTAYLANYSAEDIIKVYGTHVLLGIDIGGRLKFDYKGAVIKEMTEERKVRAVKAGISIGLAKIFYVDLITDISKEEKTKISNETTEKSIEGMFYGGTNSGASFTADAQGNTSTTINLGSWQQSINIFNAALIGINRSVPIYDFITDPAKKQQVKDAVEKYIADRQIKLDPQDVFEFYTAKYNKHVLHLDPNMYLDYLKDGWYPNGKPFKAYSTPFNNAVPIYQLYSSSLNDRMLSPNPNPGWVGYKLDGILFYAYTTNVPGTVPIYSFRNTNQKRNTDHYYSVTPTPYNRDWIYDGIIFYAFPY